MRQPGGGPPEATLVPVVRSALEQLAVPDPLAIAEAAGLHRDHPRWAVRLPSAALEWAAARPAGSRPPGPGVPMLWVHAGTAAELGTRMRQADAALSRSERQRGQQRTAPNHSLHLNFPAHQDELVRTRAVTAPANPVTLDPASTWRRH